MSLLETRGTSHYTSAMTFRQSGFSLLLFFGFTSGAFAEGAVAIGQPANVANDGIAIGYSYNHTDKPGAEQRAMAECRRQEEAGTKGLCKLVLNFRNQCVAVAVDPLAGTPGFGWSVADTAQAAAERALAMCRDTSPADRRQACKLDGDACDGTAK